MTEWITNPFFRLFSKGLYFHRTSILFAKNKSSSQIELSRTSIMIISYRDAILKKESHAYNVRRGSSSNARTFKLTENYICLFCVVSGETLKKCRGIHFYVNPVYIL